MRHAKAHEEAMQRGESACYHLGTWEQHCLSHGAYRTSGSPSKLQHQTDLQPRGHSTLRQSTPERGHANPSKAPHMLASFISTDPISQIPPGLFRPSIHNERNPLLSKSSNHSSKQGDLGFPLPFERIAAVANKKIVENHNIAVAPDPLDSSRVDQCAKRDNLILAWP
jgi:hypothetical protein